MRRPPRPVVPLFLVALGCAALASSASAATYTVDDAGDGAGTCPGPGCTLRQAIDDANANAGTDTIDFDALVTQISPATPLPTVSEQVTIVAGHLVRIDAVYDDSAPVLTFDGTGADSAVAGVSIGETGAGPGHASAGIDVVDYGDDATPFTLANVFIGVGDGTGDTGVDGPGLRMLGAGLVATGIVVGNNNGAGLDLGAGPAHAGEIAGRVTGSKIGVDSTGTTAAANDGDGIFGDIGADFTIGGPLAGDRNVISGNTDNGGAGDSDDGDGIDVAATNVPTTPSLTIQGNTIGPDITGAAPIGNEGDGIEAQGFNATHTLDLTVDGNVVSDNSSCGCGTGGLYLHSDVAGDVTDNLIGVDATGTAPLPNIQVPGIDIEDNDLPLAIEGNTVSANFFGLGIGIAPDAGNVAITGNFIGTDANGDDLGVPVPQFVGVLVNGDDVTIGGPGPGDGNVISGNVVNGVNVDTDTARRITILGNRLGTNAAGTAAVPNGCCGVLVHGVDGRTVTVGSPAAGNLVSGNAGPGIDVEAPGTVVQNNVVGTNAGQTGAIPNGSGFDPGVLVGETTTIGGAGAREGNVIAGNSFAGVILDGTFDPSLSAVLLGNRIGVTGSGTVVGNADDGIAIGLPANGNRIGPVSGTAGQNIIAGNGGAGIHVFDGSGNTFGANSIFDNAGLGIALDSGTNGGQAAPALTGAAASASSLDVAGTATGPASSTLTVRLFANDACDTGGAGEGKTYLGSLATTTDGGGGAAFSGSVAAAVAVGTPITATVTDAAGSTSQFSQCFTAGSPPAPPTPPAPPDPPTPPTPPTPPVVPLDLTGFGLTPKKFAATAGSTLFFRVTKAAQMTFIIEKYEKGRLRRGRCTIAAASRKTGTRCVRWDYVRRFNRAAIAGSQNLRLDGSLGSPLVVPPGRYRILAVATAGAERTRTLVSRFTVTAPKKR